MAVLQLVSAVGQDIRINEFMASNDTTIVPGAAPGTFEDWIEIVNTGASGVDIGGWHLTDNPGDPGKWTIPLGTMIAPGQYLIVFASGDTDQNTNGSLHAGFKLSADGEYVGLSRDDLTVVSEFGPMGTDYPPQEDDVSYGISPSDLSPVYFAVPTPGAANDPDGFLPVTDTKFSVGRGFYTSPVSVAITTATSGATVYYTVDGTEPLDTEGTPGASAMVYTTPLMISGTTVLRAAASRAGLQPTDTDTQTYIFPADITMQIRPSGYPTAWGADPAADYDVDQAISLGTQYGARFLEGLREIPTVSVVTDRDGVFGASGIYSNPLDKNLEVAVSAEYFQPSAVTDGNNVEEGFQIDCGFKVQGGASRRPDRSNKHSFSLRFRQVYGESKLDHDVFGDGAVDRFNSLHLRAMYNNSWIHSNSGQRARATMIRDQWMRDSLIAMGNADGGYGRFVHLFINGLYWGVYNFHERLDNDHYTAYEGGDPDTVTGYNPGSGSHTIAEQADLDEMRVVVESGDWNAIKQTLDVGQYIDYYLMQHFGHNNDLKTDGNWRAAGGGTAGVPWRLYLWDSERVLESVTTTGSLAISQDGVEIIDSLDDLLEFRVLFADRAYKHLANGGALTNMRNRTRFERYVTMIDKAIIGESARWGDARAGGDGTSGDYTRDENWMQAIYGALATSPRNGILGTGTRAWFGETGSNRTTRMISALKIQRWPGQITRKLPADPPQFAVDRNPQHGGEIPGGSALSLTGGSGQIYYTLDGSDPRFMGGALSGTAVLYTAGASIPFSTSGIVRTRWLNGDGEWSALNEAEFFVEPLATVADLRITEVHYHPADPSAVEQLAGGALAVPRVFEDSDFSFIEIANVGGVAVNLSGVEFIAGVRFAFSNQVLPPGGLAVVVEDAEAFAVRYPSIPVFGQWTGELDKDGEMLSLGSAAGVATHSFTYDDGGDWPGRADGEGSSLEVVSTAGDYIDPVNWRPSCEYHGSPGSAGIGRDDRVVINEILAHTDPPLSDTIELSNLKATAVDISGWFLSDGSSNYRKFRIPEGTTIPGGGYIVFDESDFNIVETRTISTYAGTPAVTPTTVTSVGHGLATGDVITIRDYVGFGSYNDSHEVVVTGANTFTIPVAFIDDAMQKGSWTRWQPFALSSSRGEEVFLLETDSAGRLTKFIDQVGFPASLNGVSFGRWPDSTGGLTTMLSRTLGGDNGGSGPSSGPVFVSEIHYDPTGASDRDFEFVEICNPTSSAQSLAQWTLRGDADFDFTSESLAAGGILVVVGFDPTDGAKTAAFRAAYGIDYPLVLVGPWDDTDSLADSNGTVRLRRADDPPSGEPNFFPQVIEDEIFYEAAAPWPESPGGGGDSLNRLGVGFGSFPGSWVASTPTPGLKELSLTYAGWAGAFGLTGGATGDSDQDGVVDLVEYAMGLDPTSSDRHLLPEPVAGEDTLTFTYTRNLLKNDVTMRIESSEDLVGWSVVPDSLVVTTVAGELRQAVVPVTSGKRFFRMWFSVSP